MEDYIYILIGILWIVFSVIKANKKAQRPVEEIEDEYEYEESPAQERSTFDELLEEFLGEKTFEKKEDPPRPVPPIIGNEADTFTPEIEKYEEFLDDSVQDIANMGEPIYELDGTEDAMVMEDAESNDGMYFNQPAHILKMKKDFDLRQAIVYNAIIDRPYA
jgi:hypothetical protein